MRIMISGGHLTPAVALIDYINDKYPDDKVIFVGRELSRKKDKQPSQERPELQNYRVEFVPFSSGKIGQGNLLDKFVNFFETAQAVFHAAFLIPKYKPDIFVSFGGYLAVPLAMASWLWRIPIITHEQTRATGVANKFIAKFAKKVALSYPETKDFYPSSKTVLTGNPIRPTVTAKKSQQPSWFTTQSKKPILYVTGGSQGSEVINNTVAQALSKLLADWVIIHQCGQDTKHRSYQTELEKTTRRLSKQKRSLYFVQPWISADDLSWIYENATAIISRAGANTTAEIAYHKVPSVLIPLPFSHHDEQLLNAKALSDTGGSILLPQKDLNPQALIVSLEQIKQRPNSYRNKLHKLTNYHQNAAKNLYQLIKEAAAK